MVAENPRNWLKSNKLLILHVLKTSKDAVQRIIASSVTFPTNTNWTIKSRETLNDLKTEIQCIRPVYPYAKNGGTLES